MVLFGARLKLSVTDGNWPWWLIASGAVEGLMVANWLSGTMPPPRGLCIDSAESVRPKLVARIDFEDDVVFIQGRVNPRHVALTKGVVENGIDQGGIDSQHGKRRPG